MVPSGNRIEVLSLRSTSVSWSPSMSATATLIHRCGTGPLTLIVTGVQAAGSRIRERSGPK